MARMKAEKQKHTALVMMIGHSHFKTPKAVQKANPATVTEYMPAEMAPVSRVLTIFQAWGAKLVMEQIDAT